MFLVTWGAVSGGLVAWHLVTERRAQSPAGRAALWQKRHSQYEWNHDLGEYRRIVRKAVNGQNIVSTQSRSQRVVQEDAASRRQKFLAFFVYPLLGLGIAIFQATQGNGFELVGWFCLIVFGATGVAVAIIHLRYITGYQADGFGLVIDPPRREPKADDFGPAVGGSPLGGPVPPSVDLGYKPNGGGSPVSSSPTGGAVELVIVAGGAKPVNVVAQMRRINPALSYADAMGIIERSPQVFASAASDAEAETAKASLEAAGAIVALRPSLSTV